MSLRRPLLLALLLVPALAEAGLLRTLATAAITPDHPFAAETPPSPPDYALPAAWSSLPGAPGLAASVPPGVTPLDPATTRADVFYVHPTSSVAARWNADALDPKLAPVTDRGGVLIQASAFNGVGAIWAPRYRQATGLAYEAPSPDGDAAIDLAFSDVERAFDAFLAKTGERPFFVVGHSQGAALASRLLPRLAAFPGRFVAAYLGGSGLTEEAVARAGLHPCHGPTDLGCVVAWNARTDAYEPGGIDLATTPGESRLCVNPLSGSDDGVAMPASANLGAVFLRYDHPSVLPGFADGACERGTLVVRTLGKVPADLPSRILFRSMGPGNLHPVEFELYWMNLRSEAARRLGARAAPAVPG